MLPHHSDMKFPQLFFLLLVAGLGALLPLPSAAARVTQDFDAN
jgi:hypothetical protein